LGEYLYDGNIVLGPAVFDAANWYDKLEMIGIIATPQTTISLKSIFLNQDESPLGFWCDGVFGKHPLKNASQTELYALNWPSFLDFYKNEEETEEDLFYQWIRAFPMPYGTELKFQNTEQFFQKLYTSSDWESWFEEPEEKK
jgi:hypothetical protein